MEIGSVCHPPPVWPATIGQEAKVPLTTWSTKQTNKARLDASSSLAEDHGATWFHVESKEMGEHAVWPTTSTNGQGSDQAWGTACICICICICICD